MAYFMTQDPPKGTNGSPTHGPTLYGGNWGEIQLKKGVQKAKTTSISKLGPLEPKNITFTHIIMILAILAHFSLLWQFGFSKMVTMSMFYDSGTNGAPTHGPTTYGGKWGQISSKIGVQKDEMASKPGFWQIQSFFNPLKYKADYNLNSHIQTKKATFLKVQSPNQHKMPL